MFRFQTLTQRFGALYALVIAILIGVSAVVTVHLDNIRVDSERLIEEAREQTVTAQLIAEVDSLEALLAHPDDIDVADLGRARELLRSTRSELVNLEGDEDDPSRAEHQLAESRIADRLADDLARADEVLAAYSGTAGGAQASELLSNSKHYAQVLMAEAREEARKANSDLHGRARKTGVILVVTWISAVLLLGVALSLIQRGVVRPLRRLSAGAERFGRGDRGHRIQIDNTDEIGDLASSFNAMADRLARAQDDLEDRVRQRTREFIRAARLADLGLLASGVAHEINTPLASIASSAEGLLRRSKEGDVPPELLREYSQIICDEAFRAREITTRMLALVRQEPSEVSQVPLRLVVQQAEAALRYRAERRQIRLASAPVPEDLTVSVNAGELVQILVNLLANAIDASEPEGRVDLRTDVREGELVIEVEDEGSGIRDEDLERVFEPFFTTKSRGEGTGLGLALVATMVEFRGGHVSVRSVVGDGSVFRVTLPVDWSHPS